MNLHRFSTEVQDAQLQFRYQVIDLRELDCEVLLASPALGDTLLALLCQMQDAQKTVHEIVQRIAALEETAREDALIHFLHLAGLRRKISPIIAAELDAMPITVNVRDNPFYQKIFHAGAEQGKAEGKADSDTLELWVERVLSEATLEGVLQ